MYLWSLGWYLVGWDNLLLNHMEVVSHYHFSQCQIIFNTPCHIFQSIHQFIPVLMCGYKKSSKKWPLKLKQIILLCHGPYLHQVEHFSLTSKSICSLVWINREIPTLLNTKALINTSMMYFVTVYDYSQFTCLLKLAHWIHTPIR